MPPDEPISPDDLDRFAVVRASRVRPERAQAMGRAFIEQAQAIKRSRRKHLGCARAWEAVCPGALVGRTSVLGVKGGAMTIGVADHATRYELDRLLREGGERELVKLAPTTVRRVRLVVNPSLDAPGSG
jgi:hypothetical protein